MGRARLSLWRSVALYDVTIFLRNGGRVLFGGIGGRVEFCSLRVANQRGACLPISRRSSVCSQATWQSTALLQVRTCSSTSIVNFFSDGEEARVVNYCTVLKSIWFLACRDI
jgi:hypothetical protein